MAPEEKSASAEMIGPAPPPVRPHTAIEDRRAEFAEMSTTAPADAEFRAAFVQSKLRMALTHPALDLAGRDEAISQLVDVLGVPAERPHGLPTPGGVGYGFFYTSPFKTAWGQGTSLICDYVCPSPPGGNVNTFLYLTASNRSGEGVEALVAYNGQATPHFRVFDWARPKPDQWQTDAPFTSLGDYLTTMSAHGYQYPTLRVQNSTWLITDPNQYRNQVLLHNHVRGGWDLVYQYDYSATDAQQKSGWSGSWGPIVETFQSAYVNTKPMGVLRTQLISSDNDGNWGSWALLASSESYVRTDNVGFDSVFLDPNYDLIVISASSLLVRNLHLWQ
jgi:hypothetical protein